jgi:hypothetical protein
VAEGAVFDRAAAVSDWERVMSWFVPFVLGGAMVSLIDWIVRFWLRSEEDQERLRATRALEAHGLTAHMYIPSMGIEDEGLREVLDRVALGSTLILSADGVLIGRVLPNMVREGRKKAYLRLVVDNTKDNGM